MLLYANDIKQISNFMKNINSIYAMYYNKKTDRVGYVFRNRFKSVPIMDRKQLYTCIKYIHMNPVKAGKVKEESDYRYSSYNDYLTSLPGFTSFNREVTASEPSKFSALRIMPSLTKPFLNWRGARFAMNNTCFPTSSSGA